MWKCGRRVRGICRRRRVLGGHFLDEYEGWEKRTRRFPESCPEIAPGIRGGFLARFKYHVTTLGGAIHCVFSTCALPGRFR